LLYEPVYADYEKDTPETIKQIDKNNIIYDELCMFKPPPPPPGGVFFFFFFFFF